jgi:hypothetical protein
MMSHRATAVFALCAGYALYAEDSAESIMAKVAENQDRAQEMRSAFVYHQSMLIRFKRSNGKLAREEQREYTVAPTGKGFKKDLIHFTGKYEQHGKYIDYDKPGHQYKDLDIDGDLANDLANDLTNEEGTRDGFASDLFPLNSKKQKDYNFRLGGQENYRGTDTYRITFKPRKPSLFDADEDGNSCWAGEALIDAKEHQPVLITTWLAKGVPMAVQILLGTNVKHVGFKVAYRKFDEGLWFPVSYGGEFYVRGVFFYKRTIALAITNSGFRRADVTSTVSFDPPIIP